MKKRRDMCFFGSHGIKSENIWVTTGFFGKIDLTFRRFCNTISMYNFNVGI